MQWRVRHGLRGYSLTKMICAAQIFEEEIMSTQESKGSRGSRPAVQFAAGLEKSLSAYASAAAAAGVSLLALAPSADAKIVYTPANITIPINGGPVFIDLNHDGTADFSFSQTLATFVDSRPTRLRVGGKNPSNQVWGKGILGVRSSYGVFASALRKGFKVRPNKSYFQKAPGWVMFSAGGTYYGGASYGQWLNTQHRFLGVKFMAGSQIHYGWARFTVAATATLTGYAYETIANKPIIAGKTKGPDVITLEPVTLGHLAQGASVVAAWRRTK